MVDKKILKYDKKLLKFWLTMYAGCSFPEYFGAKKGECGLELQQVPEEYVELLTWFKEHKFKSYLELGVGRGGSFMLNVLFQPELEFATAVDNSVYWKESQQKDIENKISWLDENTDVDVDFYSCSTDDFFKEIEEEEGPFFDCIFIDADHSYEGVRKDFDNALKYIKSDGYIIFHDIASTQCPGVMKIWEQVSTVGKELDPEKSNIVVEKIEFIHGHNCGIGIIKVKRKTVTYKIIDVKPINNIQVEVKMRPHTKGLVIIETRKGHGLIETIDNHRKFLGPDWGLHVVCSEENKHELTPELVGHWKKFQYETVKHHLDNRRYNRLITSPMFWDNIRYEKVLISQTDARMLREGIDQFMEWDYVGAPWTFCEYGGNGGFSLRTTAVMREICDKFIWTTEQGNEDIFFCNIMHKHNIGKLAPRNVCSEFSMETIYKHGTLGVHAIHNYFDGPTCQKILKGIPA